MRVRPASCGKKYISEIGSFKVCIAFLVIVPSDGEQSNATLRHDGRASFGFFNVHESASYVYLIPTQQFIGANKEIRWLVANPANRVVPPNICLTENDLRGVGQEYKRGPPGCLALSKRP